MKAGRAVKVVGFGVLNFLIRFVVGGILFVGVRMNPEGLAFGLALTLTALVAAYVLLRFVLRPRSVREAVGIGVTWATIALFLDVITAEPMVGVTVSYLFSEIQTWTRLIVIVAVAPFTIRKQPER